MKYYIRYSNSKTFMGKTLVSNKGNTITIHKLNRHAIGEFYENIRTLVDKQKFTKIRVKIASGLSIYPNQILPSVGVAEYYRSLGIIVEFRSLDPRYSELANPKKYQEESGVLGRIWMFTEPQEIFEIVDEYRKEFERVEQFAKGTLQAMEWALNEVMDNVLQHSKVGCGYVMAQYHKDSKRIALAVFDYGQGIMSSFSDSEYSENIQDDVSAIQHALQERVTRDKSVGQGNGLFGLVSIVKEGHGLLNIRSGRGYYSIETSVSSTPTTKNKEKYPNKDVKSTLVDFQLKSDKEIDLKDIELFKPYNLVDLHLEEFEDDANSYVYDIAKHSEGTGTRKAGMRARNQIMNLIKQIRTSITLDFSNVGVMSSSYADELIVKLLLEIGIFQFSRAIRLRGLSETHERILDRSFRQRTSQEQIEPEEREGAVASVWGKCIAYVKGWLKARMR